MASAIVLAGASGAGDVAVPAELRGGRLFAVPRTVAGEIFACWLDASGGGFIFDAAAERFRLAVHAAGGMTSAELPAFDPARGLPRVHGGTLPVFERTASDRADPILQGFEAQLGRTWFSGRRWRLDFRRGTVTMLAGSLAATEDAVPVQSIGGYPYVRVDVDGDGELLMGFDTAASVAYAPSFAGGTVVQATSFVTRAQFERWVSAHPAWTVERNVSTLTGVDRITVPRLRLGTATFSDVAFTTRPNDDVFDGMAGDGAKLGANAYRNVRIIIDYPAGRLRVEPSAAA